MGEKQMRLVDSAQKGQARTQRSRGGEEERLPPLRGHWWGALRWKNPHPIQETQALGPPSPTTSLSP